jgi:hypothetical protein
MGRLQWKSLKRKDDKKVLDNHEGGVGAHMDQKDHELPIKVRTSSLLLWIILMLHSAYVRPTSFETSTS